MSKIDITAIKEGFKELLRTALMAMVPLLISQIQSPYSIDWRAVGIAGVIAILSGIDKWAHKAEKGLGNGGITGF